MLERTLRLNSLYDFYAPLLTNKQRKYMKMYYFEDYSLAEISEVAKVSRQAVYDTLKRTENVLESYEEKLALHEKFLKRMSIIDKLENNLNEIEEIQRLILKLKELS